MTALRIAEETVPPGEAAIIQALVQRLRARVEAENAGGPMRRDAHPKMHGLVQAEFIVEPGLPADLRGGLFAQPARWPAWVRFSNQDSRPRADSRPDIRGIAIKLMGVPGTKLLAEEAEAPTHDFIGISTPRFVTCDAAEFDALLVCLGQSLWAKLVFFLCHGRVAWNLLRAMRRHANPLQINYHSTTPYRWGDTAVKYAMLPQPIYNGTDPNTGPALPPGEDHLRLAMAQQLRGGAATFDFMVQLQTDPVAMPIEDPGVAWSQAASPLRKVATLHIPAQEFDTPARRALGEVLSFTPWHALPAHRPLGGINRARKVVYQAISVFRHQANQQPRREPTGFESP